MKWYHYIGIGVLAALGFEKYALYAVAMVQVGRGMRQRVKFPQGAKYQYLK